MFWINIFIIHFLANKTFETINMYNFNYCHNIADYFRANEIFAKKIHNSRNKLP